MKRFLAVSVSSTTIVFLCSGAATALAEESIVFPVSSIDLEATEVSASSEPQYLPSSAMSLMPVAPGGQVSTGAQLGILGNRSNLDTPFNLTGYTSSYIADSQSRSIADVAAADPSVRVIFPRASYRDVYSIRGFNLFSYNMGFDGLYGIAPKQRYPAGFAERIEILKGPDTFINGVSLGGSVGGAINIVPKRATEEPVTTLTTSYESNRNVSSEVDVGRRFGELAQWGVRINGLVRGGDLDVDDQSDHTEAGSLSLDYQGDRTRLYLDLGDQQQKVDSPDWAVTLAPEIDRPPKIDASKDLGEPWTWVRTKDRYAVVRGEHDLNEQWTMFASLGTSKTQTTGLFVQPTSLRGDHTYTGLVASFPSSGEHVSSQIGVRGVFDTGPVSHQLTLSSAYWLQNLKAGYEKLGTFPSTSDGRRDNTKPDTSSLAGLHIHRTAEVRFGSVVLADTLGFFEDRLQLTIGARDQSIRSRSFGADTGIQTATYSSSKLSPAYALVYKLTDRVSLYGNYVEALQQGPNAPSTVVNVGEVFAPVVARQVEAGIKTQRESWTTSLSVFQITQPNGITDLETNIFSVSGQQRNRGIEWNISGQPLSNVRALGGVTVLDGRETKTAGAVFDDNKAVGVPNYQANMSIEWDTSIPDVTMTARTLRTGTQYIDQANTQHLPAWSRYDLGARYSLRGIMEKPIELRASVENVLNTNYWASAAAGQSAGISRGAPRTVLVSSTFSF